MRASGILMHITSLPGAYGVGTMGKSAFSFVDFLKRAGQSYWQILPLNPTGFGDSPYQSCSTFAGNPYLVDLDLLAEQGLLRTEEICALPWGEDAAKVDFGILYQQRQKILRLAYERFTETEEFKDFCRSNSSWLADFALYMALKQRFDGTPWFQWKHKLKYRDADAIWQARQELKDEIQFHSFVQFQFASQWANLRSYAHENGVRIIGDVPIYVPYDSVDVWSNPELFQMDGDLAPTAVAGCPPDAFSEDGQLWGNPLYRWNAMAKDRYAWWIRRLQAAGKLYDVVRLDHFRGFEAYWSVPYGEETAKNGQWIKGPDMDFIREVKTQLPELDMIAEDLGFLTQEVLDMRDASGFPGMKVLEFAFDSRKPSEYLPHTYTCNSVCYIGTHDNMPLGQWLASAGPETVAYAAEYMHLTPDEGYHWGVIRTAMSTVSDTCIIQMQDYLNLGAEARMNFPGTMGNNWTWRANASCMDGALADRIFALTKLYGRVTA